MKGGSICALSRDYLVIFGQSELNKYDHWLAENDSKTQLSVTFLETVGWYTTMGLEQSDLQKLKSTFYIDLVIINDIQELVLGTELITKT